MIPNTRVRPADMRNSITPSCSPLRHCSRSKAIPIWLKLRLQLFHRTLGGIRIAVVLERDVLDHDARLAVGVLDDFGLMEILHRELIGVEAERPARRFEVGLLEGRKHRRL